MSVIGIDLGTAGAVMASVRGGKVQVLRNEISERCTPAIVSYTASGERIAGDQALNALNSNFRCSCRDFKGLLGRRATPEFLASQKHYCLAPVSCGPGGHAQYELPTTDAPISAVQAMSSYLMKLSDTAKAFLAAPTIGGVVLSVPSYYTATRIDALKASAEIAKVSVLNCVREYMAVCMDYGIYRRKQFDEINPTVTAFVSVGHGYSYVTIAEFTQHYGKILSSDSSEDLGSRKLDDALVRMMADKFKKETGLDAESNPRARLKLETAAAKAKKTLSANKEASYGIECLMEGEDCNGVLLQGDLEAAAQEFCHSLQVLCTEAINQVPADRMISSVELVGNGSRAPLIIQAVEEAFRMRGQRTLSADETVARGCALYAALFSPTVRMKEYPIFDWMHPVPQKLRNPPLKPAPEAGLKKGFFNNNPAPETAETQVPAEGDVPADASMPSDATDASFQNLVEETIPSMTPEASPLDDPVPVEEEQEDLTPLPEPSENPELVADPLKPGHIRAFIEQEKIQSKKDKEATLRKDAINNYESTIFYCRDKARSSWAELCGDAGIIEQINNSLDQSEEWLWDHMEERFSVYEDRLEDLKHFIGQWFDDFKPKPAEPEAPPAGDAPTGDAPTGDAPTGDVPTGDVPAGETPPGEAPAGETPAGEASHDHQHEATPDFA